MVDKNDIRFCSSATLFQNSTCVFAEYLDCVQLSGMVLLDTIRKSTKLEKYLDLELIRYLELPSLLEYYINRKDKNPLADLWKGDSVPYEELDEQVREFYRSNEIFFDVQLTTTVHPLLKNLLANALTNDIRIYCEEPYPGLENDIKEKFDGKATLVTGKLEDVLQTIPGDTTYFFADIMNVLTLEEVGKLDYSAIMIPSDYGYNYDDSEEKKFLVDMNQLAEKHIFKWGTYKTC